MTSRNLPPTNEVFEHDTYHPGPQTTASSQTATEARIYCNTSDENAKKESDLFVLDNGAPPTLHAGAWRWEILSLCLSLASLLTFIAILVAYNRRPTPTWAGGLTLNTITSIISFTYRFGLMVPVATCISQLAWVGLAQSGKSLHDVVQLDWASRSPWGSAVLLFRTPGKK